jgi:isopenicillin-N epimerase
MKHWGAWMEGKPPEGPATATWFMPAGFQAFEHFWSIPAAIELHESIGPSRITDRIHALTQQLNEGLRKLPNVSAVYTPTDPSLNAGIVCFDVKGLKPKEVVQRLLQKKVIASTTPYSPTFARLSCGLMNSPSDVEQGLRAVRALV